ncbi:hypothetical protein AB5N19_00545 [Seiridium cardinale]|uniref:Uncharacterized protein n=1 Tax=Seiridium cardinale TaxID=138064 RepID=A0ABR2XWV0_9PEZI
MILSTLSSMFGSALFLSATLVGASPLPVMKRDTAERYTFANCINSVTSESYAAIFWYYPDYLPDFPEPQATAYVNNDTTVEYAGKTTAVTSPFTLEATIPSNATSATEGTIVSTVASASSFAGPMAVIKGSGDVFYSPADNVDCYEEYWQRDNQPVEDP